jgi:CheY-like chemotaxis protein
MRIFIAEDEVVFQMFMKRLLSKLGHTVVGFSTSADDAIEQITALLPDLVIMDINLCGSVDGIEAAEILNEKCAVPVLFLTGYDNDEIRQRAMMTNPSGYLTKPFSLETMENLLNKIATGKPTSAAGFHADYSGIVMRL